MGSEDASGNRRELLEDPRCLNMVLQERVARSHIVVFNGCFVDRDRDGLFVFFVGVVLFRVAAAVYFLAHLLMAAAPVVVLARRVTVASLTSNTSRRGVGQWGGAGGAGCEDHFALVWRL